MDESVVYNGAKFVMDNSVLESAFGAYRSANTNVFCI